MLGALEYINAKHRHWLFEVIIGISLLLLWQYFVAALCRVEIVLPHRFRRFQILASLVIAYALAYGCYRLAGFAVFLIAAQSP